MTNNTSDIPQELQERLGEHKVIPFVGAGVSMAVRRREAEERLFPSSAGDTPTDPVPVAYEVVSFSGDALLTDWTGFIEDFSLNLHNTGTWIVKSGILEYT